MNKIVKFSLLCFAGLQAAGAYAQSEPTKAETDSIDAFYNDLDELVVSARKEVVKSDGDKLTYDLEQDDSSKGQNLLDAMRKVPMVQVDGQDNITVKGSGNFKIFVNGKEDPMLTANYQKVFKAMPASSVSKIELITEPGAKYDAEGTAGIINIVTEKKQTKEGYTANVSLSASNRDVNASLYGRMKYGNFTADANFNYGESITGQKNNSTSTTVYDDNPTNHRQVAHVSFNSTYNFLNGGINMSWEPNAKNLFTAGGNIMRMSAKTGDLSNLTEMLSASNDLQWSMLQKSKMRMGFTSASVNTSYRHNFNDAGQNLILTYYFNYGYNPFRFTTHNEETVNYASPYDWSRQKSMNYNREHTAQIDYTLPLQDEKHTIEAGAKSVFRHNTADSRQLNGATEEELAVDPDNIVDARQIQDVYALYASYKGVFGNVTASGGVRYERSHMGIDFLKGGYDNFRTDLNDVVPNAAVTYNFSPANNLRLAYQMRISRPGLEQLNPFRMSYVETEVRMGNPNLESEKYHNITLTYSNFGQILGGNISLEASRSNNTIEERIYYDDNVQYTTYGNLGRRNRLQLNGFLMINVNNNMRISLNGAVNYSQIKSTNLGLENHGWNGNAGVSWNYTGPWKLKFGAYGGWSSGDISLQGKWYGYNYYGISIGRSFLKEDALSVTINANNFLTSHNTFKSKNWSGSTHSMSKRRLQNWRVGISLSWNFGKLTDRVKQTGADMQNSDLKEKSDKGQGGGFGI